MDICYKCSIVHNESDKECPLCLAEKEIERLEAANINLLDENEHLDNTVRELLERTTKKEN